MIRSRTVHKGAQSIDSEMAGRGIERIGKVLVGKRFKDLQQVVHMHVSEVQSKNLQSLKTFSRRVTMGILEFIESLIVMINPMSHFPPRPT